MARVDGVLFCDRCGAEVTWSPYIVTVSPALFEPAEAVRNGEYCCQDCAEGLICKCAERMEFDDERRKPTTGTASTPDFTSGW